MAVSGVCPRCEASLQAASWRCPRCEYAWMGIRGETVEDARREFSRACGALLALVLGTAAVLALCFASFGPAARVFFAWTVGIPAGIGMLVAILFARGGGASALWTLMIAAFPVAVYGFGHETFFVALFAPLATASAYGGLWLVGLARRIIHRMDPWAG